MSQFANERPRYEAFTAKLTAVLRDLLSTEGINAEVDFRTKSAESFRDKVDRADKNYNNPLAEVTDISGVRLVLRTVTDVRRVGTIIEREFEVDQENSVKKIDDLEADRFGYLSEHYIVGIKHPRSQLPEWKGFSDLVAEIQVRTILQHAWASVQHSLDYKNNIDIPNLLRRRLFRLSALFELADQELNQISSEVINLSKKYAAQVRSEHGDIELNVDSLRAYLLNSATISYWTKFIKGLDVGIGPIGSISRDVEMARFAGISTIGEIDTLLQDAKEWGEGFLRDFYVNTFGEPIPKGRCSTDLNGVFTIFLIATFPDRFTNEILETQFRWGKPERATVPAKQHNPRFSDG